MNCCSATINWDIVLSVITAITAIIAIVQTNRQIKLSNKHHLFDKRIEYFNIIKKIYQPCLQLTDENFFQPLKRYFGCEERLKNMERYDWLNHINALELRRILSENYLFAIDNIWVSANDIYNRCFSNITKNSLFVDSIEDVSHYKFVIVDADILEETAEKVKFVFPDSYSSLIINYISAYIDFQGSLCTYLDYKVSFDKELKHLKETCEEDEETIREELWQSMKMGIVESQFEGDLQQFVKALAEFKDNRIYEKILNEINLL